jgi:hypothetical protein
MRDPAKIENAGHVHVGYVRATGRFSDTPVARER